MSRLLYLDSSAIVKLVRREPETGPLRDLLASDVEAASSDLARIEVLRALRRTRGRAREVARAEDVLERIALVRIDDAVVRLASSVPPAELRSLDAIHLATALSLGSELDALVTYDERLADAARVQGLTVGAPGRG